MTDLPQPSRITRPEQRIARSSVPDADWCVLDNPPAHLLAPGGAVLCHEGTLTPHPDAERAARSAWEILNWYRYGEVLP